MRSAHTDILGNVVGEWTEVHAVPHNVDTDRVPDASIVKVLDWVGYDPDRAKAAITAELSRDHAKQRKGLLEELQARLKEG